MVICDHIFGVLDEVGKVISEEEEMGVRAFSIFPVSDQLKRSTTIVLYTTLPLGRI